MLENEKKIIVQAKKGDSEAFGKLYDHYVGPIYRFVSAKVNTKAKAEDITHDVFLRAWERIAEYTDRGLPFSSWLYRMARNKVIDEYRTLRPTIDIEEVQEEHLVLASTTAKDTDQLLGIERVKAMLHHLTSDQRDVIILRYFEELSPREISLILGKSEGAIRVIQHRAIEKLSELTNGTSFFGTA